MYAYFHSQPSFVRKSSIYIISTFSLLMSFLNLQYPEFFSTYSTKIIFMLRFTMIFIVSKSIDSVFPYPKGPSGAADLLSMSIFLIHTFLCYCDTFFFSCYLSDFFVFLFSNRGSPSSTCPLNVDVSQSSRCILHSVQPH